MKPWSLLVKLKNGLVIQNPDVRCYDMDWGSGLYSSGIEFLRFAVPGRIFTLANYERYNYFLEATQDFSGGSRGATKLQAIYICGAHNGMVDVLKVEQNKISVFRKPLGKEYYGTASRGWKDGIFGSRPKFLKEKVDGDLTISLQH